MHLYNYFRDIILESANKDEIVKSIQNKNIVLMYYEGDDVENPGYREVEPYVYGINKNNNELLRAYQTGGISDQKRSVFGVKGWKLFRVDKISNYKRTDNIFNEPRKDFNPRGDGKMRKIYEIASFDKKQYNNWNRKVQRPSYDELINDINELGFRGTARKYGVTHRTIQKWKRYYEKYQSYEEIKDN